MATCAQIRKRSGMRKLVRVRSPCTAHQFRPSPQANFLREAEPRAARPRIRGTPDGAAVGLRDTIRLRPCRQTHPNAFAVDAATINQTSGGEIPMADKQTATEVQVIAALQGIV
jgi:hypothetical protein